MAPLSMRKASSFLQEKYKIAKLIFTDVSEAELRTKEVTDHHPWSPDAKTMTQIAGASYEFDEYWRIVDVLHYRLYSIDWKKWRSSYNSLTLLEFLITHGPEDIALEFRCDMDVIRELGTFQYRDDRGLDWGICMKNKSERILELMQGGPSLYEVRMKAIKLTNGINGFGNSPTSSSSSSPASSWTLSFDSYCPSSLHAWDEDIEEKLVLDDKQDVSKTSPNDKGNPVQHRTVENNIIDDRLANSTDPFDWLWRTCKRELCHAIGVHEDENEKKVGFFQGSMCSKQCDYSPLESYGNQKTVLSRVVSDVRRKMKKILVRQHSLGL